MTGFGCACLRQTGRSPLAGWGSDARSVRERVCLAAVTESTGHALNVCHARQLTPDLCCVGATQQYVALRVSALPDGGPPEHDMQNTTTMASRGSAMPCPRYHVLSLSILGRVHVAHLHIHVSRYQLVSGV